MLFGLSFANMVFIVLQLVLAFHSLQTKETRIALYSVVFAVSMAKLVICNGVRSWRQFLEYG